MMFPGLEIFTGKTGNQNSPLQIQRAKQIQALQIYNQHVVEVNRDIKYRIGFTAASQNFTILIILPPEFPQTKPTVSIWPPVRHPWVHPQSLEIIGCPGLNKFSVHSDLGLVVNSIIQEFQARPPTLITSKALHGPASIIRSTSRPRSYSHGSDFNSEGSLSNQLNTKSQNSNYTQLSSSHPELSNSSQTFQLSTLSLNELKALSQNEDELKKYVYNMAGYKHLAANCDALRLENQQIAQSNLEMKPIIEDLKQRLIEKYETSAELQKECEDLMEKHSALSLKYSPPSVRDKLHEAALEVEHQSELIAQAFCKGDMTVDKFLSDYMTVKTISYHRKAREEKLTEQLKELNKRWY